MIKLTVDKCHNIGRNSDLLHSMIKKHKHDELKSFCLKYQINPEVWDRMFRHNFSRKKAEHINSIRRRILTLFPENKR